MLAVARCITRTRWLKCNAFAQSTPHRSVLQPSQLRCLASASIPPPIVRQEQIKLREYQEECIQSVLSYLRSGHKRLGISLATGSGKTVIFTQLIDRVHSLPNGADKTLILAHRRELVEQAANHCRRAYPHKSVEIDMGSEHATGQADITVASVRSLQVGDRLEIYDPSQYKLVLVDEAHHIVAQGYLDVLEHFGLDQPPTLGDVEVPALVGVSATFSRFDGLRLGSAIDHIVYHRDYVDMIGEKWLCDVKFTTVKSQVNLSRVKTNKDGDFSLPELAKAVDNEITNEITVKSWLEEAGDRKSTLVFCVDLDHVASLTDTFRKYGIEAHFITGNTKKKIRGERLDAFRARKFPVLLNCGVFTEGTDVPNIDCVLLARPTKSRNLLVQMIGRGMRLYAGKQDCHVIDMVASLETGIVTVPTLFGLDPSEVVKGQGSEDLKRLKEEKDKAAANQAPVSGSAVSNFDQSSIDNRDVIYTHYDSVYDLIEDTSGERHIRVLSQNAWVQVDFDKYVLASKGGNLVLERRHFTPSELKKIEADKAVAPKNNNDAEIMRLEDKLATITSASMSTHDPTLPLWHVVYKYLLPRDLPSKTPWSKPRTIATSPTLSTAVAAADTFAASKFERLYILYSSHWRKTPASEGQLDFINKLRSVTEDEPLTEEDLTKGQAGDMITKIKFGARGRFDRMQVKTRKAEKQSNLTKRLREKENVKVGPLEA